MERSAIAKGVSEEVQATVSGDKFEMDLRFFLSWECVVKDTWARVMKNT